jgi:protein SCO1/2
LVNDKTTRILLIFAAFLSGLVVVFVAILFVTGRTSSSIGVAAVGGPFHLEDQSGKVVTDQDLKGKPYLVFFGYTHCPDICPTTLFDMSQVMKQLGPDADRTGALFITVDPERDTPAVMKDYLSNFDPHLRGLTGDQASIDAAIKEYRAYAKKVPLKDGDYTMDHTAVVYLMDKNGNFIAPFDVTNQKPEAAAAELRRYM